MGMRYTLRVALFGLCACLIGRSGPAASTLVGDLEVLHFKSTTFGDAQTLRIWLPPGYKAPENAKRTYSVLYMMDGQNLFDERTASFGVEWRIDETMTRLIGEGKVEPIVVIGIDAPGERRGDEYIPYPDPHHHPELTPHGLQFASFLVNEVLPLASRHYRLKTGPEHTGVGGSSYGAVAALYALLGRGDVFGIGLLESPSMQVGNGQILRDLDHLLYGPLRVSVGAGEDELGGYAREPGESDAEVLARDQAYVRLVRALSDALAAARLQAPKVLFTTEPGAHHQEKAWAERFPAAIQFLFPPAG